MVELVTIVFLAVVIAAGLMYIAFKVGYTKGYVDGSNYAMGLLKQTMRSLGFRIKP